MLRYAVIGIGNSGANLLASLRIPGPLFQIGTSASLPDPVIQALPAMKLPGLARNYECVFVAGDPFERPFGQLVRDLSLFLSERASFLAAFLLCKQEQYANICGIREIADYAHCCFRYEETHERKQGASLYLRRIINLFLSADLGNCACVDLTDASALFNRNLDAHVFSASALGKSRALQAAKDLSKQLATQRCKKIARSLLHISLPRDASLDELVCCCNYLERHNQLGSWLFSASKTAHLHLRIDILCASPLRS